MEWDLCSALGRCVLVSASAASDFGLLIVTIVIILHEEEDIRPRRQQPPVQDCAEGPKLRPRGTH